MLGRVDLAIGMWLQDKVKIKINSAIAISQYLIDCYQIDDAIKLQKLLFFLTLESLKQRDCLLFPESFEAWIYGPVVPEVYYYLHHSTPLNSFPKELNFIKKLENQELKTFIDLNLPKYLKFSTIELRDWAHQTNPWINARVGYDEKERSQHKIKTSALRAFAHSAQFEDVWNQWSKKD